MCQLVRSEKALREKKQKRRKKEVIECRVLTSRHYKKLSLKYSDLVRKSIHGKRIKERRSYIFEKV